MKKVFVSLLSILLITVFAYSQEDPGKALKKAAKDLSNYNLDTKNNGGKLQEAKQLIDLASAADELQGQVKTWQTKGEIYNTLSQKEVNMLVLNPDYVILNTESPIIAANSFMKALDLASKKYEKKDALTGLEAAAKNLNIMGNSQINSTDYKGAFNSLYKVLEVNKVIIANGGTPSLEEADVDNTKYVIAYCASVSDHADVAKQLFKELYDKNFDEPGVYSQYFNILLKEGDDNALAVLEKGREKYPDNSEILFGEINYYIQKQEFDKLEEKLKEAIAKEPDNPSVYSALGNVYMNLFTDEYDANGKTEKASGYFDGALEYFQKALELKPDMFDAIYSLGSLYFNEAVEIVKKMQLLGMTKEDQKKYEEYKKQSDDLFNKALPYFKKAEAMDPNDTNTLIALTEIFARTNDFEKSTEFKKRLQVVKDGAKNESSYFNE